MTSEQRLDRLERVAKLFVRAGPRARRGMREQDEKINVIIDNQIANMNNSLNSRSQWVNYAANLYDHIVNWQQLNFILTKSSIR